MRERVGDVGVEAQRREDVSRSPGDPLRLPLHPLPLLLGTVVVVVVVVDPRAHVYVPITNRGLGLAEGARKVERGHRQPCVLCLRKG